jgi:isopentenyldiphosphate isomerase
MITPAPEEVMDFCYKPMDSIRKELEKKPELYTAWFAIAFPIVEKHIKEVSDKN